MQTQEAPGQEAASEQPETKHRSGTRWLIAAVVILGLIGVGVWAVTANQTDDDQAVATELADTWLRGGNEHDPEVVRSVFTDDAVYSDVPFGDGGVKTLEQHLADVDTRGLMIANMVRVGEVIATDHGTFIFVAEFDAHGSRFSGEVEIELDGDHVSRMDWLSLDVIDS